VLSTVPGKVGGTVHLIELRVDRYLRKKLSYGYFVCLTDLRPAYTYS
jgi:hypothetical protein